MKILETLINHTTIKKVLLPSGSIIIQFNVWSYHEHEPRKRKDTSNSVL